MSCYTVGDTYKTSDGKELTLDCTGYAWEASTGLLHKMLTDLPVSLKECQLIAYNATILRALHPITVEFRVGAAHCVPQARAIRIDPKVASKVALCHELAHILVDPCGRAQGNLELQHSRQWRDAYIKLLEENHLAEAKMLHGLATLYSWEESCW